MKLVNLGDRKSHVSFKEALASGIAPDGSLYFPEQFPIFSDAEIGSLPNLSSQDIGRLVITKWLGDEIPAEGIDSIVDSASTFDTPIVKVGDKYILELFHGPTMAFKDVAARYLAALMGYFNEDGADSVVLVATSGDTGGAIAHGFDGQKGVKVVVLFPKGRVSDLQYEQLTRVGENITSLEVDGSFDDCQELVKTAFTDESINKKLNLTSANSISIGRLLPQIIYYVQAYARLQRENLRFVVPTGNLGNLTAGLFAWKMGIPIRSFVGANNENDALTRYLETGTYNPNASIQTMSNAMDVGAPNNLPRFIEIFGGDVRLARQMVSAIKVSDAKTIETIRRVYTERDYLLDPHTAVAWSASEIIPDVKSTDIIVATASPDKFQAEIETKVGIKIPVERIKANPIAYPSRVSQINNNYDEFKAKLEKL